MCAALRQKPEVWLSDASRHPFWWAFIDRRHPLGYGPDARLLGDLIQAGFTPSRADVGRARVHWAGADARFDATLEALLLDDRLASPSSVSPSRPRLRM